MIEKSDSEVHLGVDMNCAGTADIKTRVQMARRTMYAMMGAGAYGCSGVFPSSFLIFAKSLPFQECCMAWMLFV